MLLLESVTACRREGGVHGPPGPTTNIIKEIIRFNNKNNTHLKTMCWQVRFSWRNIGLDAILVFDWTRILQFLRVHSNYEVYRSDYVKASQTNVSISGHHKLAHWVNKEAVKIGFETRFNIVFLSYRHGIKGLSRFDLKFGFYPTFYPSGQFLRSRILQPD